MKKGLTFLFTVCAATLVAAGTDSSGLDITHRMMVLAIQVGVILFAARFGNLLFTWLRLPSVLGELCAGMVIGPYALGRLWEGWVFQLFPGSSVGVSPELYGLCTVASIVLLFLVGAETDLKMFMRYSAVGSLVGVGGVVFSYLAGATIGVWLLGLSWSDPTTILLGVMSTATSVSITARILSDRHKLDSQEGVTILAGAVIDDVLGIIMLAIGMGLIAAKESGETFSWGHIVGIAAKCFGIWLGATAVGILVSRKVAWLLRFCGSHGEVAILTLGLALLVGGLFEQASLAMIIGAYVTGLAFSRTDMGVMIQEKLHGVYQFLVPVFFVVMGMMVNIGEFAQEGVLVAGLIYTAVAVVAKIVGCGLPTLLFGFTPVGALRVGLGMVPRGEVALIIAGIAAAHGHTEILGVAVLMTMLTTLVSPPLLLAAFNIKRPGHRHESAHDAQPAATYHFPNHTITDTVMGKILLNLTKEGFFTHQINPAQGLYQARRDDTVADSVAGLPDSGTAHAVGYANRSGIPLTRPFIKYTATWPRSFMPQNQKKRDLIAHMKLIPIDSLIRGKRLVLIDDSLVRGTQMRGTADFLYKSGAKELHIRLACPPLLYGCPYLNFSRSNSTMELIARRKIAELEGSEAEEKVLPYTDPDSPQYAAMVEGICKELQFTSLKYHRLDDMIQSTGLPECKLCTYCWNGKK